MKNYRAIDAGSRLVFSKQQCQRLNMEESRKIAGIYLGHNVVSSMHHLCFNSKTYANDDGVHQQKNQRSTGDEEH